MGSDLDGSSVLLLEVGVEVFSHTVIWTKKVENFQVLSVTDLIVRH